MKRRFLMAICAMILLILVGTGYSYAAEGSEYGTAGSVSGEECDPGDGDDSNWLTIRAGDHGVRIVDKDGNERIAVDNFGGVYLNGDVYLNQQMINQVSAAESEKFNIVNGFFYLMLIISLGLNIYCTAKINKH